MGFQVELSRRAEEDIAGVLRWFNEQRAPAAGSRWLSRLMDRIETLEQRPGRCPLAAGAVDLHREVRELLVGKKRGTYRILFEVDEKRVFILRIWHSARGPVSLRDL